MNPDIYGTITAARVTGTTMLRVTVVYYTVPSGGTSFLTANYDYDLKDSAVTDEYIERDLRTQAEIIADGLRRFGKISDRLGAIGGARVKLT